MLTSLRKTPKTSTWTRINRRPQNLTPKPTSTCGTLRVVIGKPLSPIRTKPKNILEKAVWISRLHRDTTEEKIRMI